MGASLRFPKLCDMDLSFIELRLVLTDPSLSIGRFLDKRPAATTTYVDHAMRRNAATLSIMSSIGAIGLEG